LRLVALRLASVAAVELTFSLVDPEEFTCALIVDEAAETWLVLSFMRLLKKLLRIFLSVTSEPSRLVVFERLGFSTLKAPAG